ncbi:MAG: class I SAM-dependent DNA methyltransferase [Phycisphaerae bacterium]|nr:class I SAM-dependent DNA methyltransferase [Phycisphaerae bacterium]
MDANRSRQLAEFVEYARTLKGDEKGEAQVFLDRLFRAFSRRGYKEAGATLEMRLKNDRGGTAFADLVWKPIVLIEMKKRGEDLSRHLTQAFDYWVRLVPGRPRYVVLCNFDEFRVYDFDVDINDPLDTVALEDLPTRYGPLNFFWPTNERPVFGVDRVDATRKAADKLAAVYRILKGRRSVGAEVAQRFVLQCLVCFFSEDIGLLPRHFFTTLLEECSDPPKAFDLLDGLFRAMNQPEGARGGRYRDVPYFNGGIFAESAAVEIQPDSEGILLREASTYNWAHVSPDIFGTIFQHSMDEDVRHAFGAHYTSPTDIMKIVKPTIVDPFTAAIDEAESLKDLARLRGRLQTLRVLDPACGSGNFLYIAYREMRRLEAAILAKENLISKRQIVGQTALGGVAPRQFFGIDILPFAVELAKVTLSLAPKLASDELHTDERTLPLDNLDANILCKDALINADGTRADWPAADIIIGNPPFLGAKRLKPERGADYVNAVRKAYPEVPGMADYCVHWFRRAHDHLKPATPDDPFTGRVGLVGTQNIRNNQSRVGGLDYVVKSGVIVEAVENQPWSGEANVHVSIANWVKTAGEKDDESALLIPSPRRLWSRVDPSLPLFQNQEDAAHPKMLTAGKHGKTLKDKSYELAVRECAAINSALSDETDLSVARILRCNAGGHYVYRGLEPGNMGFLLTPEQAERILRTDPTSREVLSPYLTGREMVTGDARPERWLIDFQRLDILTARKYAGAFAHVQRVVLPQMERIAGLRSAHQTEVAFEAKLKKAKLVARLDTWWQLRRCVPDTVAMVLARERYIVCSLVTKRPIFVFVSKGIRPSNLIQSFAFDDDYSFGILQCGSHWRWFVAKCSKLKSDFRYTPESVFDTFPWPQSPTKKQIRTVAAAGCEVRRIRAEVLPRMKGGLRALYRTLELPGRNPLKDAHADLDAAVLDAYGFNPKKDLLKQLLDLNLAVAKAIDKGDPVTAPGVPPSYGDPADLITEDCIQP